MVYCTYIFVSFELFDIQQMYCRNNVLDPTTTRSVVILSDKNSNNTSHKYKYFNFKIHLANLLVCRFNTVHL